MEKSISKIAFGLILAGAVLSIGRAYWSNLLLAIYSRVKKHEKNERLRPTLEIYLMLTGMIFTILGLLGMFRILEY